MLSKKSLYISIVFGIPFLLGIGIVGYWYLTIRLDKKSLLPNFGTVPEFSLVSEDNGPISNKAFAGHISIVDFIFTDCAGACPVMSTKMSEMQATLLNDQHIQFVSISVDPETDTPEVLRAYAEQYHAKKGRWVFLTGGVSDIQKLSKEGFHLGLDVEGGNAIIHSQKFVLVDHHGAIRGYYDSDDEEAMKTLLRDTRILSSKMD